MQTAEVVILGGGIVGSSIAWHLTEAGCRNVLMVEREAHQGKGSTGKSMGGVRAQFATKPNIQMSLYSIPFFAAFEERLGHPSGYRDQGYLFVATKPSHLEYLRTNQALQKSLGLTQARMTTRDDIVGIVPQLRADDVWGGSFCPTDGFVDPYSVMVGFTTRACEQGATLWRSTEVIAIHHDGAGIAGAHAAHADPYRGVQRSVARSAHGGRHDHRLSFSAGEFGVSAGVERSPGDDGLQHEL